MNERPVRGGFVRVPQLLLSPNDNNVGRLALFSDLHIGSAYTNYRRLRDDLQEAFEDNAYIFLNGDIFDAIATRDVRSCPTGVHPRISRRRDVIGAALDWAEELLAPYASRIHMVGVGNHEAVVERNGGVDVVMELHQRLGRDSLYHGHYGGFSGWIDVAMRGQPRRYSIYYHHGNGPGGTPRAAMDALLRKATWVREADIIWRGHVHHPIILPSASFGPKCKLQTQWLVGTGSYLESMIGQSSAEARANGRQSNYAADAGVGPTAAVGVARVELSFTQHRIKVSL